MKHTANLLFGLFLLTIVGCESATTAKGQEAPELKTKMDTISYVVGYTTGSNLQKQGLGDIDLDVVLGALNEGLAEKEAKIDMQKSSMMIREYLMKKQEKEAKLNLEKSTKFLAKNKNKNGVVTTESGLQYKVITKGEGPTPQDGDTVKLHYHGTLIDGTVFDSSIDRGEPITMNVDRFVKGFSEGLKLMPEGSKYTFYIPSELGYGKRPMPNIDANSILIFEVELLEINPETASETKE